jgi:hypothetical protein
VRLALTSLAGAIALLTAAVPAPAAAAEPIMPLAEVRPGQRCEARSVVQGTAISTFAVEVLDVIAGDPALDAPRILFRASGPAVDRTGLGPGFSGSPIACDGRVIGAVSEAIGEYGGLVALATPIELVVGEPVHPPAGARRDARLLRRARPLAAPISVSGLSPAVGELFRRAAARHGQLVVPAPARPLAAAFPPQPLVPGAAMAVGLTSGDVTAGAIGTVAYTDGDLVWGFGHPLDGAGRRSLFLQDAYVYTVVNNPIGAGGVSTYKLAAPGHDVGLLSADQPNAVVGRVGPRPATIPVRVTARDADTGQTRRLAVQVADEQRLDLPIGISPLSLAAPAVVAQSVATVLRGLPARQSGTLRLRMTLRGREEPLGFRRRYVVRGIGGAELGLGGVGGAMVGDVAAAVGAIDEFNVAALQVTGVDATVTARRGLRQAFLLGPRGRRAQRVRRGKVARVRVRVRPYRERIRTVSVPVRIPRSAGRGRHLLVLDGPPSDGAGGLEFLLGESVFEAEVSDEEQVVDELGPRSVDALAKQVRRLGADDAVRARLDGGRWFRTYRDPDVRLSGRARIPVVVR